MTYFHCLRIANIQQLERESAVRPSAATWPWFVLMDEILGQKPSTAPPLSKLPLSLRTHRGQVLLRLTRWWWWRVTTMRMVAAARAGQGCPGRGGRITPHS